MTHPSRRGRNRSGVNIQALEDRQLLTVFGNVWPNHRDLTVSFPADGVQIGSYGNQVHSLLDSVAPRQNWQELVLRAYQTWAIHADINIGLRNDFNNDFGTPGKVVGDPRFGEFRIGAFPQQGLVANSVPFQAIAGTYSGDLVLNSNEQFTFHDWGENVAPDPATINAGDRDLFSLFLHEAGNTLGLTDNLSGSSVMFRQYTVPKGILAPEDIVEIQTLYGLRSDPYELIDNGTLLTASLVSTPSGIDPLQEVLRTRGSLVTGLDADVYKIIPVAGADSVTLRLRAHGVSLLQGKLEVVDALGQTIDQASAVSVFDNDSELIVNGISGQSEIYVRVSAADETDVYSVGDYWLEVDYRSAVQQAADPSPGAYDAGPDTLFANYELIDPELGANETVLDATEVFSNGPVSSDRFEFESSVSTAADVDFFKITAPSVVQGRLVAHVVGVGAAAPGLRMQVVDATGQPIGTSAKLHADGTFTVEVASPQASQDYYMKVSVDPGSAVGVGNYVAVVEFEAPAAQMNDLASGSLTSSADRYIRWTADKTKLFRFDLQAVSADADHAVRLTVYDAHTRQIKMVAVARAGVVRGALAWLQQGEYILRFTALSVGSSPVNGLSYSLRADGVSDDQDEDSSDPADDPNHDPYGYYDSGGSGSYDDPVYDYYYDYYDNYYTGP